MSNRAEKNDEDTDQEKQEGCQAAGQGK